MPSPLAPSARPKIGVLAPRAVVAASILTAGAVLCAASPASASTSATSLVNSTAYGRVTYAGYGTYGFSNFNRNNVGVDLTRRAGLAGRGVGKTVVKMWAHTSTKARIVPRAFGRSNPLWLMKVAGHPRLSGFTLQGTAQGHLYNGLAVHSASYASVSNVRVAAIPGAGYNPPQETFGIADQRSNHSQYTGVIVDGAGVGAVGLAANSSSNLRISRSRFINNRYSAGVALWQTRNATLTDVVSVGNRTGLNFERCSGTITVIRPTIKRESNQDLYIGSDQGSARIIIKDPVTTNGHLRIRVPASYHGHANRQHRSDVRVYVKGVDRTRSVVTWI